MVFLVLFFSFETLPISHMRVQDIYIPAPSNVLCSNPEGGCLMAPLNYHQFGTPWSLEDPGIYIIIYLAILCALFGMVK